MKTKTIKKFSLYIEYSFRNIFSNNIYLNNYSKPKKEKILLGCNCCANDTCLQTSYKLIFPLVQKWRKICITNDSNLVHKQKDLFIYSKKKHFFLHVVEKIFLLLHTVQTRKIFLQKQDLLFFYRLFKKVYFLLHVVLVSNFFLLLLLW